MLGLAYVHTLATLSKRGRREETLVEEDGFLLKPLGSFFFFRIKRGWLVVLLLLLPVLRGTYNLGS